jgi:hypothetical protein
VIVVGLEYKDYCVNGEHVVPMASVIRENMKEIRVEMCSIDTTDVHLPNLLRELAKFKHYQLTGNRRHTTLLGLRIQMATQKKVFYMRAREINAE